MWIKMLKDQVGPDGIFLKGQTVPLPLKIVEEKLDSDSYVQVDVDEHAMQRMGVEERLQHLGAEMATLDAAIKSTKDRLADLHQRRKVLRTKIKQADDELEQVKLAAENKANESKEQSTDEGSQTDESAETGQQGEATDGQSDKSVTEG